MRTIEDITNAMTALVDGAADRSLTDEEVTTYEGLETELATVKRDGELRARNAAYNTVRPARPAAAVTSTREALPYNLSAAINHITGETEYRIEAGKNDFGQDLAAMARNADEDGSRTEAGRRVMDTLRAVFRNNVVSTDVNELNPNIQRPDLFVDQRDYKTPLLDLISRGTPPNGVQPFIFPKFSSAGSLVGDHTEGTEPTAGTYVTTDQTVTPSAISGKVNITREAWDMGGNPAVSTLVFNQMVRGYREGLETAAATFLNTLTAATDITLTAGGTDAQVTSGIEAAIARLAFTRGYDFSAFVMEQELYAKLSGARDTTGRAFYPIITPTNANGTAARRFRTLDVAGTTGIPSWALASTAGSANNSWLFDPTVVHAWWTAPQRLEFPGATQAGAYAPVAFVGLGIWGYKAFANSDIGGVRQVIYDTTA